MTFGIALPLPPWKTVMISKLSRSIWDTRPRASHWTFTGMCRKRCSADPLTGWRRTSRALAPERSKSRTQTSIPSKTLEKSPWDPAGCRFPCIPWVPISVLLSQALNSHTGNLRLCNPKPVSFSSVHVTVSLNTVLRYTAYRNPFANQRFLLPR